MSSIVSRVANGRLPSVPDLAAVTSVETRLADRALLFAIIGLGLFGAVMIASASMPFAVSDGKNPFHYFSRQLVFLAIGALLGSVLFRLPLSVWEKYGPHMILVSVVFLALVLIPGIGHEANGSRRWLDLGLFTVQVSETVKLLIIVYLAGYLVRRGYLVQNTFGGFLRPVMLIVFIGVLLVLEPDLGAAVVIIATAMMMLFVAGVRFWQFAGLVGLFLLVGILLIVTEGYRAERLAIFLDPFSDPFNHGFQLTQSLIAVGSGGWSGVGFGNSIQKLLYLPEAHTDFLFAVLCEELGLIGAVTLIALYGFIVWRCFRLARQADEQGNRFAGFIALGIGGWIGLQSFINMGVNLGVLPTKGITLPLMSYGGSSAVVFAAAFSLLLRVEWELQQNENGAPARDVDAPGSTVTARTGRTSRASVAARGDV